MKSPLAIKGTLIEDFSSYIKKEQSVVAKCLEVNEKNVRKKPTTVLVARGDHAVCARGLLSHQRRTFRSSVKIQLSTTVRTYYCFDTS